MRETKFIEQNKEKWLKFEHLLRLNKRDPDQLSDLFIQITDDLSYARTHYPHRSITIYLNNLAQQLFYNIYKNKKQNKNKLIKFWKDELPTIVYHSRWDMVLAMSIFIIAAIIGVVSSVNDPDFSRTILGDSYIDMTIENIENNDPMAVYKKMNEVDMFLGITFNNVMIAFRTFITGILFSLGSVIILMYNGIMVGTFQYFFIERGLFTESFLTIWLHGTLEISSIIIAGAAGIVLGKGFVFPGTLSRLQAFQISARRGLKLLIGIVPILTFAALIESFVTRYTETPDILKIVLILVSLFFILFYFAWLPYLKYKNGLLVDLSEKNVSMSYEQDMNFDGKVKKVNEIFREAILIFKKLFSKYARIAIPAALVFLMATALVLQQETVSRIVSVDQWIFGKIGHFINFSGFPVMFVVVVLFMAILLFVVYSHLFQLLNLTTNKIQLSISVFIGAVLLSLPWFLNGFFSFLLFILLLPMIFYSIFIQHYEIISYPVAIRRFFSLSLDNFGRTLGLYSLLMFISFVFLFLIDSPFMAFYVDFIRWNFDADAESMYYIALAVNSIVIIIGIVMLLPLMIINFSLQYFSLKEISEANDLKKQINDI